VGRSADDLARFQTDREQAAARPEVSGSFDRFYADEYLPMVRLAHLVTGSNDAAEDLVQEAFLRMAPHWGHVDRPVPYLRRIVVNRCLTWRGRRSRTVPLPDSFDRPAPAQPVAEMLDAIARLPPRRRAAIVLRFYTDLPEAEIAQALGCRSGTVKSLLSRGLAQLRKEIER